MTEHDFLQYRPLERERAYLCRELKALSAADAMTDPAGGSRYAELLLRRKADCQRQLCRLEEDIARVEDSRVRLILSLRYQKGYSWQRVATAMGEYDESYPRRLCHRYFEKSSLS